jgi:hypothetical protein
MGRCVMLSGYASKLLPCYNAESSTLQLIIWARSIKKITESLMYVNKGFVTVVMEAGAAVFVGLDLSLKFGKEM